MLEVVGAVHRQLMETCKVQHAIMQLGGDLLIDEPPLRKELIILN